MTCWQHIYNYSWTDTSTIGDYSGGSVGTVYVHSLGTVRNDSYWQNHDYYTQEPNYFSGLNGAAFGSAVELNGSTVYIGAAGKSRMYSVNVYDGNYTYWNTNFGAPLRATGYGDGYWGITDILYYGTGVDWSGADNTRAVSGGRFIASDLYRDYNNGNGGSTTDTGAADLY